MPGFVDVMFTAGVTTRFAARTVGFVGVRTVLAVATSAPGVATVAVDWGKTVPEDKETAWAAMLGLTAGPTRMAEGTAELAGARVALAGTVVLV